MSMLPPQFQNLSPQELQELKNQPQFQNALRQYYQRQQMSQQQQQQQQMRQGQPMGQGMGANQARNMPQNMGQNIGQNMGQNVGQNMGNMGQNMAGAANMAYRGPQQKQNLTQQQIYSRNLQQAYWKQLQQAQQAQQAKMQQPVNANINMNRTQMAAAAAQSNPSQAQMAAMYKQMQGQQQQQQQQQAYAQRTLIPGQGMTSQVGAMGAAMGAGIGSGMGAGMPGAQVKAPVGGGMVPGAYTGTSMGKIVPGSLGPMAGGSGAVAAAAAAAGRGGSVVASAAMPSPDPAATKAAASMVSKETVKLPPRFASDSVSKVQLRPLKSATEWSDKLKDEGADVPLDVKVYENIIKKDEQFLRKTAQQTSKQKHQVEKMALDIKTYNTIKQLRMNSIGASAKNQYNNSIWGEGYQGYGNGVSNTTTLVVLPHQNKSFTKVPAIPFTESQLNEKLLKSYKSGKPRHFVPIRLDFDQERDRFKLRDTFLWDINEETYPLENFVRTLIEDYKFILEQHYHTVLSAVNE